MQRKETAMWKGLSSSTFSNHHRVSPHLRRTVFWGWKISTMNVAFELFFIITSLSSSIAGLLFTVIVDAVSISMLVIV